MGGIHERVWLCAFTYNKITLKMCRFVWDEVTVLENNQWNVITKNVKLISIFCFSNHLLWFILSNLILFCRFDSLKCRISTASSMPKNSFILIVSLLLFFVWCRNRSSCVVPTGRCSVFKLNNCSELEYWFSNEKISRCPLGTLAKTGCLLICLRAQLRKLFVNIHSLFNDKVWKKWRVWF